MGILLREVWVEWFGGELIPDLSELGNEQISDRETNTVSVEYYFWKPSCSDKGER